MRNQLLTISLLCTYFSWGQITYRPLPETDASWIQAAFLYSAYSAHEHATITSIAYTQGDTLINGQSYTKFINRSIADWVDGWGQQNQNSGTDYHPEDTAFFRQDIPQKKVYLWNETMQTDELLYDFGNLTVGQPYPETVSNLNYPNLLVMAQDSIQLLDGNYYKRWVLGTNSTDSAYVSVIEGVGGTNGFNTPIYPVFEQASALLCHKTGIQHIYEDWQSNIIPPRYSEECANDLSVSSKNETGLIIYPNPASSVIGIESHQPIQSIELYDLKGQLLFCSERMEESMEKSMDVSTFKPGIYFIKISQTNGENVTQKIQLTN